MIFFTRPLASQPRGTWGIPAGTVLFLISLVNAFLGESRTGPVLIGHRGWPTRYPDNTLSGLIAVSSHVSAVEVDVRRCGDGRLVLAHDPTLGGLVVADHPWGVLAEVDLGGGNRPALLDEALAALPRTPVDIEVKNDPGEPGFEPDHRLGLEAAERARPGDVITSFNPELLTAVRRRFTEVPTGLIVGAGTPLRHAVSACRRGGHRAVAAQHSMITAPWESEDLALLVWTVNDRRRAAELDALGASAIITDDPTLLAMTP